MLKEARLRTLELVSDLSGEQMIGPQLTIVNPLRWEIGHVAWFQENWVLRHLRKQRPLLEGGDALYDSAAVPHDTRWDLWLPSGEKTLEYMQTVLDRVITRLSSHDATEEERYFHLLALLHECMHSEAITYTRQTLGYPPPRLNLPAEEKVHETKNIGPLPGDAEIPGGAFLLGATPDSPFVFDNEKWAHPVQVKPFRVARAAVTNAEFARFVNDAGYLKRGLWSERGWVWREQAGAEHPLYWQRDSGGRWLRRRFNETVPLEDHLPIIHVNWFEAEAYCRWASRRLPTEAEWEMAASCEPAPEGRGISGRKRSFPWGDDPPTPERANLDWRGMGCLP
ncbi:MAG: SUMF1/EgtB/PvdO family nonheme iron enzyme, partial [Candidatus Binatia bacterium]